MARYAVKTPTHHTTWDQMLEVWQAADEIDLYESAWNFDHFYPIRGDTDGPCLEAWVTASALAQATKRIRVGTMVTGMHFRHPAVLASMASSLDIVSGGRLEIGLGAGWYDLEADAYGLDLGTIDREDDPLRGGHRSHPPPADRGALELRRSLLPSQQCTERAQAHSATAPTDRDRGQGREANASTGRPVRIDVGRSLRRGGKGRVAPAPGRVVASLPGGWTGPERDLLFEPSLNGPEPDPAEVATRSAAMFDAGIDVVILGFTAAHDGKTVEAIAGALSDIS